MRVLHCLVESEDHCSSVVVVEDGQRPQLGGNTVRPRNLRVAERPQYPQYPGVVGALAGITAGRLKDDARPVSPLATYSCAIKNQRKARNALSRGHFFSKTQVGPTLH